MMCCTSASARVRRHHLCRLVSDLRSVQSGDSCHLRRHVVTSVFEALKSAELIGLAGFELQEIVAAPCNKAFYQTSVLQSLLVKTSCLLQHVSLDKHGCKLLLTEFFHLRNWAKWDITLTVLLFMLILSSLLKAGWKKNLGIRIEMR